MRSRAGMKMVAAAMAAAGLLALTAGPASAASTVSGRQGGYDEDQNGYPDAGKVVTGGYQDVWAGCDLTVRYRGDFGNDPSLNSGWISNMYRCGGYSFHYVFVHETDPRYDGDPARAIWGDWEWFLLSESTMGNIFSAERNPHHVPL